MGYGRLGLSEPIDSVPELVPNQIGNVGSISSRRKRKPILLGLLFLLLLVVSGISATVLVRFRSNGSGKTEVTMRRKLSQTISRTCSKTLYPNFCVSTLANVPGSATAGEHDLFHISLNVTLKHFGTALYGASAIANLKMNTRVRSAYDDCIELLDDSYNHLSRSLSFVAPSSNGVGNLKSVGSTQDVLTWLSAAVTNQDTCTDGFADVTGYVKNQMAVRLKNLSMLVSNCLAIFAMSIKNEDFSGIPIHNRRRLMESSFPVKESGFPTWMTNRERKLLETPVTAIRADFVVSKDGNGTHKTIYEAIKAAPEQSMRRIIIYVKAGRYEETYLKVGRKKTNLMFIGDGKGATIISGGKSVFDNLTTFHTASFAASGAGFIARDITFENWAGPAKHQAVALRVGADHAVVYRCNIIGYQDTLYVHSQRQFFRECAIYGTVDFIFGNAAVVFQNCSLYARKPMLYQKITVTAQNRKDPNQNTGISIHNCRILATPDLQASKGSFSTYLGRPWKLYSRTVYMLSYIGDHIHPRGWLEWNTTFALDTLYYGEYLNYGPGGAVGQRVKWPGYHVINDSEANKFTVGQFIYGSSWLPSTGVAFLAGLSV